MSIKVPGMGEELNWVQLKVRGKAVEGMAAQARKGSRVWVHGELITTKGDEDGVESKGEIRQYAADYGANGERPQGGGEEKVGRVDGAPAAV